MNHFVWFPWKVSVTARRRENLNNVSETFCKRFCLLKCVRIERLQNVDTEHSHQKSLIPWQRGNFGSTHPVCRNHNSIENMQIRLKCAISTDSSTDRIHLILKHGFADCLFLCACTYKISHRIEWKYNTGNYSHINF